MYKIKPVTAMKRLNLGAGVDIKQGYINTDITPGPGIDVVHDLNKVPYPFKDNEFDEILAYSILEHVDDLVKTMDELYRILKPGGKLDIIAPHYNGPGAWGNPTHRRTFTYQSFLYFTKGYTLETYFKNLFSRGIVRLRFGKKIQVWNYLIEFLANRFPYVYENSFFSVFPASGIRAVLIK
jgi:ubiquinone/menaquinone biosynthesis C-methylase UbiE